jgi:hypothetical protein
MILSSAQTRRFVVDLNRQLALFARAVRQLKRDLLRLKQNDMLENLAKFEAALNSRQEAFSVLMSLNAAIGSGVVEAERTRALFKLPDDKAGGAAYNFLEAETLIGKFIDELDEKRILLGRAAGASEVKSTEDAGDEVLAEKLAENSWFFSGAQNAFDSLSRQAEAIVAAQWAIVHGQGLHFWQGRQRWFRYAGDNYPARFDCVVS